MTRDSIVLELHTAVRLVYFSEVKIGVIAEHLSVRLIIVQAWRVLVES